MVGIPENALDGGQHSQSRVLRLCAFWCCVCQAAVQPHKEFLNFLGLICLVLVKLTSKLTFLLFLVLMGLEFCCVPGPLGKANLGGGELESDPTSQC